MTEKNISNNENLSYDYVEKLNSIIQQFRPTNSDKYLYLSHYKNFIGLFEEFLNNEKNFSHQSELLLQCNSLKTNLYDGYIQDPIKTNQFAKESLDQISSFIQRFLKVEKSLKDFHHIFQCLLLYCYELLDLSEINDNLRNDIYNRICYQKQNFDDIKECIDILLNKVTCDKSIKKDFNINHAKQQLEYIYQSFDNCIINKDERAIHYIGAYLRTIIMNTVDYYMNSLASFRYQTLNSIEIFEKSLHQFLLSSIRQVVKNSINNNSLTSKASSDLELFDFINSDYDQKISEYIKVVEIFNSNPSTIPSEVINCLITQLKNENHSHSIYLQKKIDNLTKILRRFAEVEKVLPKFSDVFRQYLNNRYDHLTQQEVCSSNGKITQEIFNSLKSNKNFDDIKQIIEIFDNQDLLDIVEKCKYFFEDNDDKGSAEIGECLRQCIIDTTEIYILNLLDFRHSASIGFNHFEKNFYYLLSTYEIIKNEKFRFQMKEILNQLFSQSNYSDNNYNNYLSIYKSIIEYLDKKGYECALNLRDIFNENKHTLKPLFEEKINNLKKLLNGYINWYKIKLYKQYEYNIFQIESNSGILSEILNIIKSQYSDCFCPNNEIRIINTNKLYLDIDLSGKEYSGVNIVLISPYQELVNKKNELKIITDGKKAENISKNNPAKNGIGTDSNGRGNNGEDGSDGKHGESAGHVYIVANQLPPIEVSACGGQGGQGQDGGNGASGADGADGKDADKKILQEMLSGGWALPGGANSYRYRLIGTDGKSGGWGGDSGLGGFHGDRGHSGLIKIISLDDTLHDFRQKDLIDEPESSNGKPGQPGEAGKHGRDGRDYVAIRNWTNPIKALVSSNIIDNIKGGRLYSHDRYEDGEEQCMENYEMLPMMAYEDDPRFLSKYIDQDARRASNMTHKHTNQEVIQKIHAINYHHIFQETLKFFDNFINPEKLTSYQHWLASSLNEFLEKMTNLEELSSYRSHALPDIDHDAQQILILKENFAKTINAENKRLQQEILNTDQMNIGVQFLAHEILNQYNKFTQQYEFVYQKLRNEIHKVNINQLGTGLENRSTGIRNLQNTINRIINEKRFQQHLIASQRRTELLVEIPKEELSKLISHRQNIKIIKDNLKKQEWKKFQIENIIIDIVLIKKFNQNPNEEYLIKIGFDFITKLDILLSQNTNVDSIDLKNISNFTYTYVYNLQQSNLSYIGWQT
ncbi:unnamed protein product [Rotaria sordida]|uniref:Uncharacterized protein n=1 Tax=Rotaria sordida TaxID=392033 RepID=A0A819ZYV5_9BILA|nr:unnamed protein product [Rotaria sordida]